MKLSILISDLNAVSKPCSDIEISALCYDSRKVTKDCLFICLEGVSFDGHQYALQAEKSGAAAIVANRMTDSALPHIIVEDTREAMSVLAAQWFGSPQRKMKFVGITGTNGKTSTAYYVKNILDRLGKKTGLIGTVENIIIDRAMPSGVTTPEPYALFELLSKMADAGVEYVIMEVSSHSIVQKRVFGIEFDAAVFTNLTQDHLDYHKTMEEYKAVKRRLFDNCKCAVINIDDKTGAEFAENTACKKYTYSARVNSADFVAKESKITAKGVRFLAVTRGGIIKVNALTPGGFTVYNLLGAIGAVCALGIDFNSLAPALTDVVGVCGRAQIISGDRPYTVMIDYAHTPDGLENILTSVKNYAEGRIITLFGCGGDRDKSKRAIMGEKAAEHSDFVIVTSDNPRTEQPMAIIEQILPGVKGKKTPYKVIENRRDAIRFAIETARDGDIVVLAGKGHEAYQIIGTEKTDFNEQEIAVGFMKELGK